MTDDDQTNLRILINAFGLQYLTNYQTDPADFRPASNQHVGTFIGCVETLIAAGIWSPQLRTEIPKTITALALHMDKEADEQIDAQPRNQLVTLFNWRKEYDLPAPAMPPYSLYIINTILAQLIVDDDVWFAKHALSSAAQPTNATDILHRDLEIDWTLQRIGTALSNILEMFTVNVPQTIMRMIAHNTWFGLSGWLVFPAMQERLKQIDIWYESTQADGLQREQLRKWLEFHSPRTNFLDNERLSDLSDVIPELINARSATVRSFR